MKAEWNEWGRHVLSELQRLNDNHLSIQKDVNDIKVELGMLKVKSGVWGAVAGMISFTVTYIIAVLK